MLYPQPQKKAAPSYYLVIDQYRLSNCEPVVPYFPDPGEVVQLCLDKILLVQAVHMGTRKVYGNILKSVGGANPRFINNSNDIHTFDLVCVVKKIRVRKSGVLFYRL